MKDLNRVTLLGRMGADPEVRHTQGGVPIANLSVATSESWKDKSTGEDRSRTQWTRVVIFNPKLAEIAEKFLRKGSRLMIEGQLQTRKYEKDGKDHYTTEVVLTGFDGNLWLLDSKKDGSGPADYQDQGPGEEPPF